MVDEEDLIVNEDGRPSLLLRFKNCTGNIIDLADEEPFIDALSLKQAQIALSIDSKFKKSRSRTVKQAVNMVVRWRTIGLGFYDFQI